MLAQSAFASINHHYLDIMNFAGSPMDGRKKAFPEQAEKVSESDVYRTLLESTNAIPWQIDWASKRFSYIGPQIEDLLGWERTSWTGVEDWAARMHPDDRRWVVPFCVKQSEAGLDHEADYRALASDGSFRWIRDVVHVVRNPAGDVDCLTGFMFDISARKQTEEQLAALQQHLEQLVEERTRQLRLEIEHRMILEREVLEIADEERRRIGRELHDDLGQRLTGISLLAQALANEFKLVSSAHGEIAGTIQSSASTAISQVRDLAHGLMPMGPDGQSLSEALEQLAEQSSVPGIECIFISESPVKLDNPVVAAHLYRVAQEGLSNALRHSQATAITIGLGVVNERLTLRISDNGIGEPGSGKGRGLGIMEHRASLINFHLTVDFRPACGTEIRLVERRSNASAQ